MEFQELAQTLQQVLQIKQDVGLAPAPEAPPQCVNRYHVHLDGDEPVPGNTSQNHDACSAVGGCRIRGLHQDVKDEFFTLNTYGSWCSDDGYWGDSEYQIYKKKVEAPLAARIKPGADVRVVRDFQSNSKSHDELKKGMVGKLIKVDDDGNAAISFDVYPDKPAPHNSIQVWIFKRNFSNLHFLTSGDQRVTEVWILRRNNDPSRGSYRGHEILCVARADDSMWPPRGDAWKPLPKRYTRYGEVLEEFVQSEFPPLEVVSHQRLRWCQFCCPPTSAVAIERIGEQLPYEICLRVAKELTRRSVNLQMIERWRRG